MADEKRTAHVDREREMKKREKVEDSVQVKAQAMKTKTKHTHTHTHLLVYGSHEVKRKKKHITDESQAMSVSVCLDCVQMVYFSYFYVLAWLFRIVLHEWFGRSVGRSPFFRSTILTTMLYVCARLPEQANEYAIVFFRLYFDISLQLLEIHNLALILCYFKHIYMQVVQMQLDVMFSYKILKMVGLLYDVCECVFLMFYVASWPYHL